MTNSIELQIICRILTSEDEVEVERLCSYDESYYSVLVPQIEFILHHKDKTGKVPDLFTFQAEFTDLTLIQVNEPLSYLEEEIKKNKQRILFLETYNKIADLGSSDISEAWEFLSQQCEKASELDTLRPVDIVKDAQDRADKIIEYNKQLRIPTGFKEVDEIMYGGLSTVEEFLVIVARTNAGKAQPLWSKVLTPHGWTTMGELKIGDTVVGENNDNGKVVQIFPQGEKDYYRVNFDDGTYVECCDDHLWVVYQDDSPAANKQVLTLNHLRMSYLDYYVKLSEPLIVSTLDSVESRKQVFTEWMFDTQSQIRKQISVNEFVDISRSLGIYTQVSCESDNNVLCDLSAKFKHIESIEYVGKTECQCILLDNDTHTYITDGYTVTHNSWVSTKLMESAQSHGFPVLYYSPEMQSSFIGTRFDTWRGHYKNSDLYRGNYSDEYKDYLKVLIYH